jgi:type II secretory pathway pseudopilin PulG
MLNVFTAVPGRRGQSLAFTLVEVVVALAIVASVFGGIILAYNQAARRAQWSGYHLAAQGLAIQQIEQARAAIWTTRPLNDEIAQIPLLNKTIVGSTIKGHTLAVLDIPYSSTNAILATNYVTISTIAVGSTVSIRLVKVDTVWPFVQGSNPTYFTNSVATYLAPDDL